MFENYTPAPRRGLCLEHGQWGIGFYKVGLSWVALLKAPLFGLMHMSHPIWYKAIASAFRAFITHLRLAAKSRSRGGVER
jgi:hypothetical protein